MDRVAAFRRGSAFANNGKRRSVSWTVNNSTRRDPERGGGGGGGGGGDVPPGSEGPGGEEKNKEGAKGKPAGSDLKEIGLWYGGSLVINTLVGPGIFGTPKGVLAGVGSVGMSLIIWTFSGIFSMCAALCFAELRETIRRDGVEYAYITEAFGPLAGWIYTWMRIAAAEPTATAVFALAFSDYVTDSMYDGCGPPKSISILVATLGILTMVLVNLMSAKLSERMQNLASVGKTCALSVIIVMGVIRMVNGKVDVIDEGMKGTRSNPTGLAYACYNGLWSYGGWTNVNNVTSGIKKPPRNVPRVVKTIIPLVLVLYIMVVMSYFTVMSREELLGSHAIAVTWAERVLGPAKPIISIGVCLTALGSVNATFLSAGRLSSVAAKNGQMPDVASWVHVRSKTPLINVCLKAVIATLILSIATGQECIKFYIFCAWLFHGMSIVALLVLRFKNKHKKRPYKVDLWIPVVVLVIIVYLLLAPFFQKPEPVFIVALVLIFLSLALYYPVNWIKEKKIFTIPDKLTIWLQLFLKVAPKRDLRRERRSMMRRMSILARDSLFITPPIQSPAMMRRFSRRMSRLSRFDGSPALIRRLGDQSQTELRRRGVNRGVSLAEADMKRPRANSMWALYSGNKPSPAIIRKKPNRNSHSFNQADVTAAMTHSGPLTSMSSVTSAPSLQSLPILKNRFNTTPTATEDSKPGALAPPSSLSLQIPHQTLRPAPSPILEESSGAENIPRFFARKGSIESSTTISFSDQDNVFDDDQVDAGSLQVVADFESDGGGEYEVLAHPGDARRLSFGSGMLDGQGIADESDYDDDASSDSDTDSTKSNNQNNLRHTIFASLFGHSGKYSDSSSSTDDSSMDEEGSTEDGLYPENFRDFSHLPMFYYSDNELDLDSDDSYDNRARARTKRSNNKHDPSNDAAGRDSHRTSSTAAAAATACEDLDDGGYVNLGFEDKIDQDLDKASRQPPRTNNTNKKHRKKQKKKAAIPVPPPRLPHKKHQHHHQQQHQQHQHQSPQLHHHHHQQQQQQQQQPAHQQSSSTQSLSDKTIQDMDIPMETTDV